MFDYIITTLFFIMVFYMMVNCPVVLITIYGLFISLLITAKILKPSGYLKLEDVEKDDK